MYAGKLYDKYIHVNNLNIYGKNTELMKACRPLKEYVWLINQIRKNCSEGMKVGEAVDKAIDEMPTDYITRMSLIGNRAEVKGMCITEYNEAKAMKLFREEGEDKLGELVSLLISEGRIFPDRVLYMETAPFSERQQGRFGRTGPCPNKKAESGLVSLLRFSCISGNAPGLFLPLLCTSPSIPVPL